MSRVRFMVPAPNKMYGTLITADVAMYIAIVAVVINVISLWAINRVRSDQLRIIKNFSHRLRYVEYALSYHQFTPLPWDQAELEEERKKFKQEGNVVYLQNEE